MVYSPEARALLDAVLQTPLPPAATVKLATVLLLKSLMRTSTLEEGVALPEIATVASLVMKFSKSPVSWLIPTILTEADLSCVHVVVSLLLLPPVSVELALMEIGPLERWLRLIAAMDQVLLVTVTVSVMVVLPSVMLMTRISPSITPVVVPEMTSASSSLTSTTLSAVIGVLTATLGAAGSMVRS